MSSVFLVNPISGRGHLDAYARLYARALLELGYGVVLVSETDGGVTDFLARNSVVNQDRFSFVSFHRPVADPFVSPPSERARLSALRRARLVWQEEGLGAILLRAIIIPKRLISAYLPLWSQQALRTSKHVTFRILSKYRLAHAVRNLLYKDMGRIPFGRMLHYVAKARHLEPDHACDLIFFLYLDLMGQGAANIAALDSRDGAPWAGILFHPDLAKSPNAEVERYLRSRNARGGVFLVPSAIAPYARSVPDLKFALAPDVADLESLDDRSQCSLAQDIEKRARGRTIVLQVGSIAKHKGITTLLDVIAKADPEQFFFALVGEVHWSSFETDQKQVSSFYSNPPENVFIHEGYLPDERSYNTLILACDIIYAVYSGFNSSSNSLTKSAGLRRPILVARDTLMGDRVMEAGTGAVASERDPDNILLALQDLAGRGRWDFGFESYSQAHSLERLKDILSEALPLWLKKTDGP